MNESQISVRYAKALFESAKAQEVLDNVRSDMETITSVCKVPEFIKFLDNPVMQESHKIELISKMLKNKVHDLSLSLLDLVVKNGRDQYIPSIARYFIDLYKKYKGIKSASLISAIALPDDIRVEVEKVIENSLNAPVELHTETKEELLGGFVIQIDQQQYDASVASSLNKIRKQLLN